MMDVTPDIVQVVAHNDYTVSVYFCDGRIVLYDAKPKLDSGLFRKLKDLSFFLGNCRIMNDTLAWDLTGDGDPRQCIDIDPEYLYSLSDAEEPKAI